MTHKARASHVGSCLSSADLLAVLYGAVMRFDPKRPSWLDRDRFLLSKGHAGAIVYATLAETGFFLAIGLIAIAKTAHRLPVISAIMVCPV